MSRLAVLAVGLAVAGCYHAESNGELACKLECDRDCPDGLICNADGLCSVGGASCVVESSTLVDLSAGQTLACGLDASTHHLFCWGDNTHAEIAATSQAVFSSATEVGSATWDAISVGEQHVCGLQGETLSCWGRNGQHQINASAGDVTTPTAIAPPPSLHWVAVAAGIEKTCAIASTTAAVAGQPTPPGTLYCWGKGAQTTTSAVQATMGTPSPPDGPPLPNVTAIALAAEATCAGLATGDLYCWGTNTDGQLGNPGASTFTPQRVPLPGAVLSVPVGQPAHAIAAGTHMTCAIVTPGALYCWGQDHDGELGDGLSRAADPTPTLVGNDDKWTSIAAGDTHACGIANGDLYCWGRSLNGGTGVGYWDSGTLPITKVASAVSELSLGPSFDAPFEEATNEQSTLDLGDLDLSCAVTAGTAQCWGDNRYGQLGAGIVPTEHAAPAPTADAATKTYQAIAVGSEHVCAHDLDNELTCWGANTRGQATGTAVGAVSIAPCSATSCDQASPASVPAVPAAAQIAVGEAHSCALTSGGVMCWGADDVDQLGTSGLPAAPVTVTGQWTSLLQTGGDSQCATTATTTFCWGSVNGMARPPTDEGAPVDATGGKLAIAAGFSTGSPEPYGCLSAGGNITCFGSNAALAYTTGSGSEGTFAQLKVSTSLFAVAIDRDVLCEALGGTITCAGDNTYGQIGMPGGLPASGTGTISSPVACTAPDCHLTGGREHMCAVGGGHLWCWGSNEYGQLGNGTTNPNRDGSVVDVQIPTTDPGDTWVGVGAGDTFTCGLSRTGKVFCWGLSPHGALGDGGHAANLPVAVKLSM